MNGARNVNSNGCTSPTITLHVVDRVFIPTNNTIASILNELRGEHSGFIEALEFARVIDFLDKTDTAITLFLPTNEAFVEQIPSELFDCLAFNRVLLSDLVLYHMADNAEYTPSLILRMFSYTRLPSQVLHLTTDESGTIVFQTTPPASIIQANIPARNGVIHIIDGVLMPPNFDYMNCQQFVPTTVPPTTMPMPTTPPMTTPPVTMETTVDGVVTTDSTAAPGGGNLPIVIDFGANP